ncbi:MAG TPA: cytochrome c peroxidase [Polyangia bacterium]|nr:cytochrome c peroxidase [Polyangia bacterium]
MRKYMWISIAFVMLLARGTGAQKKAKVEAQPALPKTPLGLTDWTTTAPKDNAATPEKWALGQMLFWDTRVSPAGTHSCETCHHPDKGWTDGLPVSKKPDGKDNTRHSPTLYNVAYNTAYYWDGRAPTLEKQVAAAWDGQMGAKDKHADVVKKLGEIAGYKEAFKKAFGSETPTDDMVVKALATFVRSILSGDSKWDQYDSGGNKKALSASAQKGWELFRSKAKCGSCHAGFGLTDWQFHNIGIGMDQPTPDPGRAKVMTPSDPKMTGAFKTPTLRSVSKHAPYTHLGHIKTLEAMVDYFAKPIANPQLDANLKEGDKIGVELTKEERKQMLDFLHALDGKDDPMVTRKPKLP